MSGIENDFEGEEKKLLWREEFSSGSLRSPFSSCPIRVASYAILCWRLLSACRDATWPRDYHCRRNMFSLNEHVNPAERDWVYSVYRKPLWPLYHTIHLRKKTNFTSNYMGEGGTLAWCAGTSSFKFYYVLWIRAFVHSRIRPENCVNESVFEMFPTPTNNNHGNLWFSKLYVVFFLLCRC